MNKLSVVTPTYNRKNKIVSSINSSLKFIKEGIFYELIVVDDASQDGTYEFLNNEYSNEVSLGMIKIIRLDENLGVTGAKNVGVKHSEGDYIIFMDSDDAFTKNAGKDIQSTIEENPNHFIYFFRCVDSYTKDLIGGELKKRSFDLKFLINGGVPGECLPVLRKKEISEFSYPTKLRGCESLAYYKILHSYKSSGFLSDLVCRMYDSEGDDRLCAPLAIRKRSLKMILFNFQLLRYVHFMNFKSFWGVSLRLAYYAVSFLRSKV